MPPPSEVVEVRRSPDDVLAEILELSRAAANSRKQTEWMEEYAPMLRQLFPILEQVLKTAQPTTLVVTPQSQQLAAFRIKIQYEDDIKRVEGTRALEYNDGRLVIFDGDKVVARFNEKVERWWKDSTIPQG